MPHDPETLCDGCQRRIWLHALVSSRARCAPKVFSPNLQAPEVMQAKEILGHKISHKLWAEARAWEETRQKEAANE